MELRRTAEDRRLYALEGVGTLRLEGLGGRMATAESGSDSWQITRRGFWRRIIQATDAADSVVAEFKPRGLRRGGPLRWTGRELELRPAGTAFQRAVWDLLLGIPYGETSTYGALALELGDPRKVRAVGLANGRNPISIVVPCHRVIGADGSLTGYGGGLERKRHLLELEAEVVAGFRATLW